MDEDVFDSNKRFYEKEIKLAGSLLRRNRYDTVTGEWLGPDPEPKCRFSALPEHKGAECPECNPNNWMAKNELEDLQEYEPDTIRQQ